MAQRKVHGPLRNRPSPTLSALPGLLLADRLCVLAEWRSSDFSGTQITTRSTKRLTFVCSIRCPKRSPANASKLPNQEKQGPSNNAGVPDTNTCHRFDPRLAPVWLPFGFPSVLPKPTTTARVCPRHLSLALPVSIGSCRFVVLGHLLLLGRAHGLVAAAAAHVAQHLREADLVVDLLHALKVGLGRALGPEDDVLPRMQR
ncbi:hypothetical protein VTK73DRAFT_3978 [Phialemonium thermophilum]|uniref:Uncharacterized protein n=1 Tax=Phialemonium thermophilum TaxID=223376 RepID=A0ABR3VCX1_9PEZI